MAGDTEKQKKELIAPIVDAYCKYAQNVGVDSQIIQEVKNACYKELDATLYTNEKTIIENLEKLYDCIEEIKNPVLKILFGL